MPVPFTLSHPAAASLLTRSGLPVGAVVAGSMAPDVPMFVPVPGLYAVTHSLLGVVTVDVVLGVLGLVIWLQVMRDAMVDVAPGVVRERLAATACYSRRQWMLAPLAVALGALTHVVWDAFTHPGRWGAQHLGWLRETHAGLLGSAWAQYASGVLGAIVVGTWAYGCLRTRARLLRPPLVASLGVNALIAVVLAVAAVTVSAILWAAADGPHAMAFRGAVVGTLAASIGSLGLAVTWQLRARRLHPTSLTPAHGEPG